MSIRNISIIYFSSQKLFRTSYSAPLSSNKVAIVLARHPIPRSHYYTSADYAFHTDVTLVSQSKL
ncbi:hypothetical protein I7I52_04269 [Histoplasma capsulatum]|uniref:Uncharacterized protein n=1 Tax=Ajellomyces capsulatus TaxID=5037 RepID=A0A8H7YKU2_AJECA|nr:hypothetical protein I7I52_04269 [Histoplasma capsulatum]